MPDHHRSGADECLNIERFLRTSAQYLGVPFPETETSKPATLCKPSQHLLYRRMQQPVRRRTPLEGWAVHAALCGERL
jgi:hypothetical protein